MNMKKTNDEMRADVRKALMLYGMADKMSKEADELLANMGVDVCHEDHRDWDIGPDHADLSVHVVSGMELLELLFDIRRQHTRDFYGKPRNDQDHVVVDGAKFFWLVNKDEESEADDE